MSQDSQLQRAGSARTAIAMPDAWLQPTDGIQPRSVWMIQRKGVPSASMWVPRYQNEAIHPVGTISLVRSDADTGGTVAFAASLQHAIAASVSAHGRPGCPAREHLCVGLDGVPSVGSMTLVWPDDRELHAIASEVTAEHIFLDAGVGRVA